MIFDPKLCVRVDWKSVGSDFLELFKNYYPECKCLFSKKFETLVNTLGLENVAECIGPLAEYLKSEDLELWNFDNGADLFQLSIVPASKNKSFIKYWSTKEGELLQIKPEAKPKIKKEDAKKVKKSKKINWLEEIHEFPEPTHVSAINYFNGFTSDLVKDEDTNLFSTFLIDCNQWPPEEIDIAEVRISPELSRPILVYADGDFKIWKNLVKQGSRSDDDTFQHEFSKKMAFSSVGPEVTGRLESLCLYNGKSIFGKNNKGFFRIAKDKMTVVLKSDKELTFINVGEGRVLICESIAISYGLREQKEKVKYWIWDDNQEKVSSPQEFPIKPYHLPTNHALVYLGNNEIMYCCDVERPHPEREGLLSRVIQLVRLNITTGKTKTAWLEKFGSQVKLNFQIYKDKPKDIVLNETFDGEIMISPAQKDWWILNYKAFPAGPRTICWIWNQNTDQVIKIDTKDIVTKDEMQVLYSNGLDRYLGFGFTFVAKLPTPNKMIEAKGDETLKWS